MISLSVFIPSAAQIEGEIRTTFREEEKKERRSFVTAEVCVSAPADTLHGEA